MYHVFHIFILMLFDLCYSQVLSAFFCDMKCLCQGKQDWVDGLCSTENWFCGGGGSAPLYFARPPLAAFAFRLAPIGQTKILRDQAVSVVNSPQVSIYFDYLFIYFSEYFYCAFFFLSFLSVFVLLLYSSCTCASTVCRCSKGHCSM